MISRSTVLAAAIALAAGAAHGQPRGAEPPTPPIVSDQAQPPRAGTVIPSGTQIFVRLDAAVDSQRLKRGDRIPISLVHPIIVGDRVAIRAGTQGYAEVVDVQPVSKGIPGEIYIAGRVLMVEDRPVPLTGVRYMIRGPADISNKYFWMTYTGEPARLPPGLESAGQLAEDVTLSTDYGVQLPRPAPPERLTGPLPAGLAHPPPGKGQVVFFRGAVAIGPLGKLRVYDGLDSKAPWLTTIPVASWISLYFDPGPRAFTVVGSPSDTLHLDIEAGETYYVNVYQIGERWGGPANMFATTAGDFLSIKPKALSPEELKRRAVKP